MYRLVQYIRKHPVIATVKVLSILFLISVVIIPVWFLRLFDHSELETRIEGNGFEIHAWRDQTSITGFEWDIQIKKVTPSNWIFDEERLFSFKDVFQTTELKLLTPNLLHVWSGYQFVIPLDIDLGFLRRLHFEPLTPKTPQLLKTVTDEKNAYFVVEVSKDPEHTGPDVIFIDISYPPPSPSDKPFMASNELIVIGVRDINVHFVEKNTIQLDIFWEGDRANDTLYLYWKDLGVPEYLKVAIAPPPNGWDDPKTEIDENLN